MIFLAGNSLPRPLSQKIAAFGNAYRDLRISVHHDRALIVAIGSVKGWSRRKQWLPGTLLRSTAVRRRSWRSPRSFDFDGRGIAEGQKIAACGSSYRDLRTSVHHDLALIVAIRSVTGWSRRKQWLPSPPLTNTAVKRRSWRSLRSFDFDGRGIAEEQKIAACGSSTLG